MSFFFSDDQTKLPEDDKTYSEPSDPMHSNRTYAPLSKYLLVNTRLLISTRVMEPQLIPAHLILSYHDTVAIVLIEHWCVE